MDPSNNLGVAAMRRVWLGRGEATVASIGLAVTLILVTALTASGYWLLRTQRHTLLDARHQQAQLLAEMLTHSVEQMLSDGQLTAARRLVMETATRYQLTSCRVVTPAGDVIADAEPMRLTASLDTARFGEVESAATTRIEADAIRITRPLDIAGRGYATIELQMPGPGSGDRAWEAQAGVGAVGAGSMVALLVVYRHFRRRMQALGVIREALLEAQRGESSESALLVAGDLGVEAESWNRILTEHQRLRRLAAAQQMGQAAAGAAGGDSDLANGCDAMTQGLLMIDDAMRVRFANNAAALFLSKPRERMIGTPIGKLIEDTELLKAIESAIESQRRTTYTVDRRDGGEETAGVLRFSVRPVRRGDASTAMLVVEDVTQQRVAEEARHDFVAHATHELRTPLTNVRLYLETLIDEGDTDAELRAKCLNVINQETRRLERMVTDLLSVAEIEAGSMRVQRDDVRVDELLNDVRNDYEAMAAEKRIELEFRLPPKLPVIQADRDKLAVALQNVIGNAVKYTPEGGHVTVAAETDGAALSIEVTDTGIGISPEDQEKVFEKFYRASDKRVAQLTGSGLGLALAREIMRLHGGDITLESQLNQGSRFTVTVPLQVG
jgi:signal transduction histidine kinase